jgi:hypothetical protein
MVAVAVETDEPTLLSTTSRGQLFGEIFPVRLDTLPPLYAYVPRWTGEAPRAGAKLAQRLRGQVGGHWVFVRGALLTDSDPNPMKRIVAVDHIKAAHPKTYGALEGVEEAYDWQLTAEDTAEFVIRGVLADLEPQFQEALAKIALSIRNVRVERQPRLRPWAVGGHPAISIAVHTHLYSARDVMSYAAALPALTDLIGLEVADRTSALRGQIVKIVGSLADLRQRLIGLTQRAALRELLRSAADADIVLRIAHQGELFDYAATALDLCVTPETADRLDVKRSEIERALHAGPAQRAQLVKAVADCAKAAGAIADAFSERNAPERFAAAVPALDIVWGGDRARAYDRERLGADFTQYGVYQRLPRFEGTAVRITVLNALGEDADIFLEALKRALQQRSLGFDLAVARERRVKVNTPENLESAVRALIKEEADTLIAFLPPEQQAGNEPPPHARYVKSQAAGRALPSLVIDTAALHNPAAMPDLIMGLLARAGNSPFVFEEPLPYADLVVGLAVARVSKKEGDHLTGLVRLYSNRGVIAGWRAARALVPAGGGLTNELMAQLLPGRTIQTKRVLIHSHQRFHPADVDMLQSWEAQHDCAIYPVEVVSQSAPCLYRFVNNRIDIPIPGSAFVVSEQEALLATSAAPYTGTPQPLEVRVLAPLRLGQVLDSIMAMTLLHHGGLHPPSLPVTTIHADDFTEAVARGVFPEAASGERAWWL